MVSIKQHLLHWFKDIPDKYCKTPYSLPPHLNKREPIDLYHRYYTEDDEDEKAADTYYPDLIEQMREFDPKTLKEDQQLKFLDSITERYGKEKKRQ